MTLYRTLKGKAIWTTGAPPEGAQSILLASHAQLQSVLGALHRSLCVWGDVGLSPGYITPARVFVTAEGGVTFAFPEKGDAEVIAPQPLATNTGAARDLAGWLLLLDKFLATSVVLAEARKVWSSTELASALPFVAPIYQAAALVEMPPVNSERVARALAESIVDHALADEDDETAARKKSSSRSKAEKSRQSKQSAPAEMQEEDAEAGAAESGKPAKKSRRPERKRKQPATDATANGEDSETRDATGAVSAGEEAG